MRGRACSPLARGWSGRCCSAAVPSGWKCYRLNKVHLEAFPAFIVTVFACGGRSGAGPGAGPGAVPPVSPRPWAPLVPPRRHGPAWRQSGPASGSCASTDGCPKRWEAGGGRGASWGGSGLQADRQTERQALLLARSSSQTRVFWGPFPTAKCTRVFACPVCLQTLVTNLIAIKSVERDLNFLFLAYFPSVWLR